MSQVKAVAFVFTRPDAVVLFGKSWKDTENNRYRMHIYPGKSEIEYAEERPNVVLVTRPDKVRDLHPAADKIHRIVLLGPAEEVFPFEVPLLDAVRDSSGKYISGPRATVDHFNKRIEEDAVFLDLNPVQKKRAVKKKGKKQKLPKDLSTFLDVLEAELNEGDVWEDLEKPVLDFILGRATSKEFERACKTLVGLGANKRLCRAYFKWIAVSDEGAALIAAFEAVATALDDSVSVDIEAIAERHEVKRDDLSVLYNMYKGELEEEGED